MRKMIPMAGVLALALAAPATVGAQEKGGGHGKGHEAREGRGGPPRASGPDRRGPPDRAERGPPARQAAAAPGPGFRPDRAVERALGRVEERARRDVRAAVVAGSPYGGLIEGCPPGLARKNNGCLPPGQARKIARASARYDYLWNRSGTGERYVYDDGYLYRRDAGGGLLGYLPALGGALSPGLAWPTRYGYEAPPAYLSNYYGLNDRYDYRYADGVLYGVDPQTQAIGQVAALLTGQDWNVGQTMPAGYDVYNVPYDYRARYVDTPQRMYRYSDGYVYQVDPTTRLVQAAVQLLT